MPKALYGYLILAILIIIGYMYLKKKCSESSGIICLGFRGVGKVVGFFRSAIGAVF